MGTRLRKFIEEEGGFLSHKELRIIKEKEKDHARIASIEGNYSLQRRKIKARRWKEGISTSYEF